MARTENKLRRGLNFIKVMVCGKIAKSKIIYSGFVNTS